MTETMLSGVYAASLTPLTGDLMPDLEALLRHSRWLLDNGCDGLGILGTTGEANSLSLEERLAIVAAATEALPAKRLLIGTGSSAIHDAIKLTRSALAGGAFHVLVLPPFYYKPLTDDGAFSFFASLIDGVGDARLRVYLYNIPQLTGFVFSPNMIARLIEKFGPVIAGMKDSSGQFDNMQLMAKTFANFAVFAGTEQFLLPTLEAGGAGCISATANVTGVWCQAVLAAWRAGDPGAATQAQRKLTPVRLAIQSLPLIPALKGIMATLTGKSDWNRVLPPFLAMSVLETAKLVARLDELGFGLPTTQAA